MSKMSNRERFRAVLNFEAFDRLPIFECFSWWSKTLERWQSEGLDFNGIEEPGIKNHIRRYFGLDITHNGKFCPQLSNPFNYIENHDDYEKAKADSKIVFPELNIDTWQSWKKEQDSGDVAVQVVLDGYFWYPRRLFGIENHLYAFYDQPDLMRKMNDELLEYQLRMLETLCEICIPDFVTFAEDMSYNSGPMLSRELFDEFIAPYYKRIIPAFKSYGVKTFVDTDGNAHELADWLEDTGVDGLMPLEGHAGTDVALLREKHPGQLYIGGFNKRIMCQGEQAIRDEFDRLLPVAKQGGYIISCDHQTPPEVSLEDYKLYIRLFKEYAVKAAK